MSLNAPIAEFGKRFMFKKFVVYIAKRKAVAKVPNQLIVNNSVDGGKIADLSVNEDLVVWP